MTSDQVEALARPEARSQLSFWQLLRLYLDPFALFRNVNDESPWAQTQAWQYNCSHRRMLLAYARRWLVIAIACMAIMHPLGALARSAPVLFVPIAGLELGFSTALCALVFSLTVYVILGIEAKKRR